MSRPVRAPAAEHGRFPILDDLIGTRDSEARRAPSTPPRPAPRGGPPERDDQRSLFGEILDWMLAPLLLLWPLSIALTFAVARSLADAPFDRALVDHANMLAHQIVVVDGEAVIRRSQRLRELLPAGTQESLFFQVLRADGEMLAGDPALPPPSLYDYPTPGTVKKRTDQFRGGDVRIAYTYVGAPESAEDSTSFPVLVQVAETVDARIALANEIIKGVIFPQFLILPVAACLVWFGLRRGLAPLTRLQRRIRERRPDDLSPIDTHAAPAELTPLVESFNELLSRLDATMSAQRRFIADAAHQMKTPLAGLRTQSELAMRQTDPDELRRSLRQIATSSDRAAHLISQLLSLARMENLRDATQLEPLDLVPLAREVAGEWVAEALRRDIDFGFEAPDAPLRILGHALLLREMFNNLIDNALRYTPRGGAVTVRLAGDRGGGVVFEVEDTGKGIPAAERERVFDRFYRVLGNDGDGSGLGLPIVREIAEQHGATVVVDDGGRPDAPSGTRMRVRFPAAPAGR